MKNFHKMTFEVLVFSLCLVSTFPCLAGNAKASAKKTDSLPKFFKPLSWEMDAKKIQSHFPKSRIATRKMQVVMSGNHPEEMTVVSIQGLKRDYLGKAIAEVFIDKKGQAQRIAIESLGTRKETESHYKTLVKIYGHLKKVFTAQYGKPIENPIVPDDPQKYPPKSCKWATPKFDLLLFVLGDEKGYWALNVLAQRE